MKGSLILLYILCLGLIAAAHPGVGIVKDSHGNIFYTDLKQVWKITPGGERTVIVSHVHTHELYMDSQDNLFGEHLWYNGERLNTWGSYVWCLRGNGQLDTVEGPEEGFPENHSFNRDTEGNQYWAERGKISRIKKKAIDGKITILAEAAFKDIRWMHVTPDGLVYFIDLTDLYKIDRDGHLTMVVRALANPGLHSARHSIFGIWTDKAGNVYAAVYSERRVKKIATDGKVSSLVYSVTPWAPTGGVFDDQGNLWLMETNIINEVKVRKIPAGKLNSQPGKIKAVFFNKVLPVSFLTGLLFLSGLGLSRWIKRTAVSHS